MKICKKCLVEKELCLFDFEKGENEKRLYRSFCKECRRIFQNKYYKLHPRKYVYKYKELTEDEKEIKRKYWREYAQNHRKTPASRIAHAEAQKRYRDKKIKEGTYYKRYRGNRTAQSKRWREKIENKIKNSAHIKVWRARKKGVLVRLPCEVCGIIKSNAHHDDYSKPVVVRWLCGKHHREWHMNNTAIL